VLISLAKAVAAARSGEPQRHAVVPGPCEAQWGPAVGRSWTGGEVRSWTPGSAVSSMGTGSEGRSWTRVSTADKNNDCLNHRRMGQFYRFLSEAALKEVHMHGHIYTWSNECSHPTLEQIDQVFMSVEWELLHPTCALQPLASLCSDHALLLLSTDAGAVQVKCFHFRSFWTKLPGFLNAVKLAWHYLLQHVSPFHRLD
jgi:hypothetical protein